jgi:hypothetical protein
MSNWITPAAYGYFQLPRISMSANEVSMPNEFAQVAKAILVSAQRV